jgi:uncharacterized membrane protein
MNPFDLRAALLAKHAQHVVLIHFPIALFIAGVIFDFLAQRTKWHALAEVAFYNLLGAAISVVPVVVTGLLAWQFQLEGQKLKGILLMHLVLGCASAILIWIAWGLHWRARRESPGRSPASRLALETVAVAIVGLTGHLGGFLSGVNGPS